MTQRGKPQPGGSNYRTPPLDGLRTQQASVFSGNPLTPNPYQTGNLAIQRSLMEIFDDFTLLISGELKSMNLDPPEADRPPSGPKA